MNIAVIPARGGSKRIKNKNIRDFFGKPIIEYAISLALDCQIFDKVVVSTDSLKIAEVASKAGAEIPFLRPAHLSDDYATTREVIKHSAEWYVKKSETVQRICCIYATAPLIAKDDILDSLELMVKSNADYVFAATKFSHPIQRAFHLDEDMAVEMVYPQFQLTRSQDLEERFYDAGQFYWGKIESWLSEKPVFSKNSRAYVVPQHLAQDVDTEEDWKMLELFYKLTKT